MPAKLTSLQVARVLDELCVELGFCLPPVERQRLQSDPPNNAVLFAEAVFAAEEMDPGAHRHLHRQVRETIAKHFSSAKACGQP